MLQNITDQQKRDAMQRILKSDTFAHSHSYQDLLAYLVEASIQGNPPKEFAIATEVLRKGTDFDPSQDTIVRVYIYNLRKKLEQYYENEGKEEKIRLQIPKGHYELEFLSSKLVSAKKALRVHWVSIPLIALLLVSNLFLLSRLNKQHKNNPFEAVIHNAIWFDLLDNQNLKEIVLGDHFFFVKDSDNREKRTIMRRDDINTLLEFQNYRAQSIERRNYVQLRYPMFPKNSVWPMADLVALLSCAHTSYSLEYCSNVKAADFRDKDVIFVGSFHTLGAFDQTFRNSHFSFQIYPNSLSYKDEKSDTLITREDVGDPVFSHLDFGIARKIPGPNHKTILIFTSFHETGTHGIIKFFTEQESLATLEKLFLEKYGYIPQYYEILFRSSGYNRTVYTTTVEQVFEISGDSVFW